jgi:putative DNA primase/helicase
VSREAPAPFCEGLAGRFRGSTHHKVNSISDPIEQFREAIQAAGITPPNIIEADGKLRRFSSNGKPGDDAGWYLLHANDGIPAGCFGDWRTGLNQSWRADIGRPLSSVEETSYRVKMEAMRRAREDEELRCKFEAQTKAIKIWNNAPFATDEHRYLSKKRIKVNGVKIYKGALVISMWDEARVLHSLQFIDIEGNKRFLTGGRVSGCYFSIGTITDAPALCIAEGFATSATVHEATGYPVAVAFNAGNMLAVAKIMRKKFPKLTLILCADDDYHTNGNPGQSKATEASLAVDGFLAIPEFGTDRPSNATDFNDMAQLYGIETVQHVITKAIAPKSADPHNWPEPQLLTVKIAPEPYPIDALPKSIREAVEEVAGFVKAPLPLVASSALAALSLAIQGHADIKRAEKLSGPVGLFLLTIADSGERKSTCDGFFTKAIRDYEEAQSEAMLPILKEYNAAIEAWDAKHAGIKEKIRQQAKGCKPTGDMEFALLNLEYEKPEAPKIPRLLYADATPEALSYGLAKHWPSSGVVSSEAGIVFGSHGMGKDSIMRNLGLLNQLWDGTPLTIDRRSTESFTVRGARLTVALQVQEPTLREFFGRTGALARGTGFLARFLVAWPDSTQGFRPFTEAPESWPHLAKFTQRITAILDQAIPIGDDGILNPPMLIMTTGTKAAWVAFHDEIESELVNGGSLHEVRDVASKSADNAARLSVLFQIFEHAIGGAVELEAFRSASRIVKWHLHEAQRFFGELALPVELANAVRLDKWLVEYCRRQQTLLIGKNYTRQYGPIRHSDTLETAIRELVGLDRIKISRESKRIFIEVNPALIEMVK